MGAGDPGAFHSIRAAAVAFLLGSLLLGGCIFSRSPTRSPGAVVGEPHPDPGGVLEVPREGSLSVPLTRATSRWEIPLSPLWHGDRILVRGPARKGWRLLDVDPQGGVALLAVPREGTYLLCASPGSAPPVAPRGTLRLVVDRSPPAMELVLKRLSPRQGGEEPGLMLRWRVEDRLPLAEGVEIAYRSPGDDGWRVLSLRHDARGVVSWPIFPQPLRGHRLRLRARDLAGNRGLLEGSLAAGLAGTLRNGPGELLWGTKEQREEEVSPVVTAAAPKPTAEEERQWVDPFEELRRQGPILPGEGRLPIPSGIDEVAVVV
ncbi:MAG: hypothetical protein ACE5GW_02760, partial [Planctomycetota bacterium]